MVLPFIAATAAESFALVGRELRQAGLALGVSRWYAFSRITLRKAAPGVLAGVILGMGRGLGETLAVLMLSGNSPVFPDGLTSRGQPLTALIATDLGESAIQSDRYHALFSAGIAADGHGHRHQHPGHAAQEVIGGRIAACTVAVRTKNLSLLTVSDASLCRCGVACGRNWRAAAGGDPAVSRVARPRCADARVSLHAADRKLARRQGRHLSRDQGQPCASRTGTRARVDPRHRRRHLPRRVQPVAAPRACLALLHRVARRRARAGLQPVRLRAPRGGVQLQDLAHRRRGDARVS